MAQPLDPVRRKELEQAVREARRVGEPGARAALRSLAVHEARPYEHMDGRERALRLRLRAHGRQLGDERDRQHGTQRIGRLAHEVAYEHWHRMLFARFLAENELLVEPKSQVPVSLDECALLAREGGAARGHGADRGADGWDVAASFAAEMLPAVFRPGDPALSVRLAPEIRQAFERLVTELPEEAFTASDSLGWTYQFWQADRKDEVNASEAKIGADELPSVTQLFTERYMVRFLFHNTIGAWRAGRVLAERPELARSAASEAELAAAVRIEPRGGLDGYDFEYLRFVREPAGGEGAVARSGPTDGTARSAGAEGASSALAAVEPEAAPGADEGDCEASDAAANGESRPTVPGSAASAATGDAGATGPWRPAAGAFRGWPQRAADLRVLDPCCGSGHFLVEGFELLVRLRMEEEGLGVEEAVRAVLRDNLHGLEIDARCTQIAAFNLALLAWKTVGRPMIDLPPLQVACSGLSLSASKEDWLLLAEGDVRLEGALDRLHDLFGQAPILGSLIDPAGVEADSPQADLLQADYASAERALTQAVAREDQAARGEVARHASGVVVGDERSNADGGDRLQGYEERERAVAAQGISRAAKLLAGRYDLVITNVPYLGNQHHSGQLREFAVRWHPDAKADLATIFLSRLVRGEGVQAIVAPQNWLSLPRYEKFRRRLLAERSWRFVARLGPGAFETIGGHVVNAALVVLSAEKPDEDRRMVGIDVSESRPGEISTAWQKADWLRCVSAFRSQSIADGHPFQVAAECRDVVSHPAQLSSNLVEDDVVAGKKRLITKKPVLSTVLQSDQINNPDARILFVKRHEGQLLVQVARSRTGTRTADSPAFLLRFWELGEPGSPWRPCQSTTRVSRFWAGCESYLRWDPGESWLHRMKAEGAASIQGRDVWGRFGILVNLMRNLAVSLYTGEVFDNNTGVVAWKSEADARAIWEYLSSREYSRQVRLIERRMNLTTATLLKVPFDLDYWQQVAARKYPNGLPEPYSDDPTQWLFHGHPCGSVAWDENAKRTAHGPLRGDASVLHVAAARLLGYRWPAELDSEMRLAPEARAWVERCRDLHEHADADGIVCLPALAGQLRAHDRLRALVRAAYGDEAWRPAKERELLAATAGKPPASLHEWLRDRFFAEHAKLFHHRPFVWHVWDGRKDGFHALVNCHRLCGPDSRETLKKLAYQYLGQWIAQQRDDAEAEKPKPGAEARLAAALDLQGQLALVLEGDPPLDLFVRWRPLHEQAIGWQPRLDDGVRLNIRPFLRAELKSGGLKGAGILRAKPNVKWRKDRGKEPQSLRPREDFPWFYGCPGQGFPSERVDYLAAPEAAYDGVRWNDLHYTRDVKEAARERRGA